MSADGPLSCHAKLARVVLDNRGPLSPAEVAAEARVDEDEARRALVELEEADLVESVCGVCATREEVFALRDDAGDPGAECDVGEASGTEDADEAEGAGDAEGAEGAEGAGDAGASEDAEDAGEA